MTDRLGRRRGGGATIRDVARAAGVSPMTVSRVINDGKYVAPETREQVNAAIASLNYSPNPAARALAVATHIPIGLLHRFPNAGYLGEYLVGVLEETARAHVSLLVRSVSPGGEIDEAVQELVGAGVRGVILTPPLSDDPVLVGRLRAANMALVATGSASASSDLDAVGIDDCGAAYAMTRHLLGLGHRRIGFIKGDPRHASTALRLAGFRAATAEAGIEADATPVADGRYTYRSGLDAAERLLGLDPRPSAIFASNDDMAAATIAVAHRMGIDVPGGVSVCGFDDSALATAVWPELTTVRQPTLEITRAAVELVLRQVAGEDGVARGEERHRLVLDHMLVLRGSHGAPPQPGG